MRRRAAIAAAVTTVLVASLWVRSIFQTPAVRAVDEAVLRQYAGVYQWGPNAFVYLQVWHEFTGFDKPGQLVAFDESGEIRVLYPTETDAFFAGPAVAAASSIASRIQFQRDTRGAIASLTWRRDGAGAGSRLARRVEIAAREEVRFSNGDVELAGVLIRPLTRERLPAVILVHGSGAEDRDYVLPFARFLVRRGMAVLAWDKRGVGGSSGDWTIASFDDLAGDVVAGLSYLKTRGDIDPAQIGLLA